MAEVINFPDINTEKTSGFWNWLKFVFGSEEQARRRHGRTAELRVARLLARLPDTFLIVNNYNIPSLNGTQDIDHLVIGPTGVFCIDTKAETGRNHVTPNGFERITPRGTPKGAKRHHSQVSRQLHILRGILQAAGLRDWIYPMLCFTEAGVDCDKVGKVEITYPDTLPPAILKQRPEARPANKERYKRFFLDELRRIQPAEEGYNF